MTLTLHDELDQLAPDAPDQLVLDPEAFAIVHGLAEAGVINLVRLQLPAEFTYDQAESLAAYWGEQSRCLQWWIGDLLNEAERRYGHEFAQIAAATGLSEGALGQRMDVCRKVAINRRRPHLPFSVHHAVRNLPARAQARWLKLAEDEQLSAAILRERIAEADRQGRQQELDTDTEPGGQGDQRVVDHALLHSVGLAILRDAKPADDGQHYLVPNEDMARLRAAYDLDE